MEAKGFSFFLFFGADKESLEVRPAAQRPGGWGIPDLGQGRWDHPPNPRFILKWVKLGMVEEAIQAKLEKEKKGMNPNIFPIYGDGGSLQKIAMVEGCGSPKGGRSGVVGSLGVQGRRQLVGAERLHSATVHRSKLGIVASQPPFRPTYFPPRSLVLPAKVLHCIDRQQKLLSALALETLVVLKNLSTLTRYFH